MSKELVPAEPFRRIIEARVELLKDLDYRDPNELVGQECGISRRILWNVRNGQQQNLSFRNADRVVTYLHPDGPFAWHTDAELNEIYLSVDLSQPPPAEASREPRPITHGVRRGYNRGCRCEECKTANRDYMRSYMRRNYAVVAS
jgi:hypothetical protein